MTRPTCEQAQYRTDTKGVTCVSVCIVLPRICHIFNDSNKDEYIVLNWRIIKYNVVIVKKLNDLESGST